MSMIFYVCDINYYVCQIVNLYNVYASCFMYLLNILPTIDDYYALTFMIAMYLCLCLRPCL